MFYYKHIDRNGKLVSLESRNRHSTSSSELSIEITESEYQTLLEEMLANMEPEPTGQISTAEALSIITRGVVE